jgi:FtsZ-binding cell division protein ZapB
MIDEGMEILQRRVQQAIGLIERLREENQNLKNEIARMQDEMQQLKEEANSLRNERESIKGKIDTAMSMLDNVDLGEAAEESTPEGEGEGGPVEG